MSGPRSLGVYIPVPLTAVPGGRFGPNHSTPLLHLFMSLRHFSSLSSLIHISSLLSFSFPLSLSYPPHTPLQL